MNDRICHKTLGAFFRRFWRHGAFWFGMPIFATLAGCTSRAITVTSLPPGAEVSINRQVVGKTPIRVNYTHAGSYRIEMRKDRYQARVVTEKIRLPLYGYDPFAFFPDNVLPVRINDNDEVSFHYVMAAVQRGGSRSHSEAGRAGARRQGHASIHQRNV